MVIIKYKYFYKMKPSDDTIHLIKYIVFQKNIYFSWNISKRVTLIFIHQIFPKRVALILIHQIFQVVWEMGDISTFLKNVLIPPSPVLLTVDIIWFINDKDCRWTSFSLFRPFKTSADWPLAVELADRFVVDFTVVSVVDFFRETDFPLSIVCMLSRAGVCEPTTEESPVEMSMSNWSTTFMPPLPIRVSVMTDCSLLWPCNRK